MALTITDQCINCGACEPECPNQAIYEPGTEWSMAEGTSLQGMVKLNNGIEIDANEMQAPLSEDFYFIVAEKCTECKGFHEEEQCISFCPVSECLIIYPDHEETEEDLLAKQTLLHG